MESGRRPIESVGKDERIWGFNLLTGKWELCRVVETYSREHEGPLVKIFVAGGAIESTYHHPYWVVNGEDLAARPEPDHVRAATVRDAIVPGRWVDAGDLGIGDVLQLQDGRRLPITEIILRQATCRVYNLAVEGLRNYAVGPNSVLAHNNCRLAQDIRVNSNQPAPLDTNRPISRSATQNAQLQADIRAAKAQRAVDFRVNQQQVNAAGERVGINRPDLQYTDATGQRIYKEYDKLSSLRGNAHKTRIEANDPLGLTTLIGLD